MRYNNWKENELVFTVYLKFKKINHHDQQQQKITKLPSFFFQNHRKHFCFDKNVTPLSTE